MIIWVRGILHEEKNQSIRNLRYTKDIHQKANNGYLFVIGLERYFYFLCIFINYQHKLLL